MNKNTQSPSANKNRVSIIICPPTVRLEDNISILHEI